MIGFNFIKTLALSAAIFASSAFCIAKESQSAKDIEDLKQGQEAIRKELQEIKNLLISQRIPVQDPNQAPPTADVSDLDFELSNGLIKGGAEAEIVLVNITDYQCPYCSRYTRETYPQIVKDYVDTGKIRYAVVDNPLAFHAFAPKAAEAARCAKDQGKYWEMHNAILSDQQYLEKLSVYADKIGLRAKEFLSCVDSSKYADAVKKDMELAAQLKVSAVPGFIIAATDKENPSRFKGISGIQGAMPFDVFKKQLDQALNETK